MLELGGGWKFSLHSVPKNKPKKKKQDFSSDQFFCTLLCTLGWDVHKKGSGVCAVFSLTKEAKKGGGGGGGGGIKGS